ncbi:MAG: diphosphomevalonate decarboxylase [Chloroflexi bacterium]|nr:diphosphomevalonate decarboxylase [Chloroflexota bacterium]
MADDPRSATARAHSNIAFVKYWGNRDYRLRLPVSSSISMNLADLHTTTTVAWDDNQEQDTLTINGATAADSALERVRNHLDVLRARFQSRRHARVCSTNNFPMGTGIASSASAFAALTMAASAALGLKLSERELSILARMGSGSAARSIPSGYVEWHAGDSHETSFAETFAPSEHWKLIDVIAIVSRAHKRTSSSAGHETAGTSVLQPARISSAAERLRAMKSAIMRRDFEQFADVVEEDSNLMHAVMMTSDPPLLYWEPLSFAIMKAVRHWRTVENLQVCYTLDAGPNVHCICAANDAEAVVARLRTLSSELDILRSSVGCGAYILTPEG